MTGARLSEALHEIASAILRAWGFAGIGPMGGSLDEAARFSSEQAAMQSPAYSFALTFYKPEEVAG